MLIWCHFPTQPSLSQKTFLKRENIQWASALWTKWSAWGTEEHIWHHSCQLGTENWDYTSHTLTEIRQQMIAKAFPGQMSLKCRSLPEQLLLTVSTSLWPQCTHLLMIASSTITKLKTSETGFLNMTISSLYSNGLHSHQLAIQSRTVRMWMYRRFSSWMWNHQICSNGSVTMLIWTKIYLVDSGMKN